MIVSWGRISWSWVSALTPNECVKRDTPCVDPQWMCKERYPLWKAQIWEIICNNETKWKLALITNRKSHMDFRLVPNKWLWITLNRVTLLGSFGANNMKVVEDRPTLSVSSFSTAWPNGDMHRLGQWEREAPLCTHDKDW